MSEERKSCTNGECKCVNQKEVVNILKAISTVSERLAKRLIPISHKIFTHPFPVCNTPYSIFSQ